MKIFESLKKKKFLLFNIFFTLYIGINLIGGEIGLIAYFEKKNTYDMGEHIERMMNEHEDEDVSEEDVEKAKEVLDKMWDYGEEDENGEVDYLYRENNWIDGFDWTLVVGWID